MGSGHKQSESTLVANPALHLARYACDAPIVTAVQTADATLKLITWDDLPDVGKLQR